MYNKKEYRKKPNKRKYHFDPNIILPLENSWTLWYHNKDNTLWGEDSFVKINTFNTVQGFWRLFNNIKFTDQCFFLMKENIFPLWEKPENASGGTWSLQINRNSADKIWTHLVLLIIGRTLAKNMDDINGISIRPKFKFSVIKIWLNNIPNSKFLDLYNKKEIKSILGKDYEYHRIKFIKSIKN